MFASKVEVRLDSPVGPAEKADVGHTDRGAGGALFGLAHGRHLGPGGLVGRSGLAGGDQGVDDLGPRVDETGHGARRPEVDVVGMGHDDEDRRWGSGEVDEGHERHTVTTRDGRSARLAPRGRVGP